MSSFTHACCVQCYGNRVKCIELSVAKSFLYFYANTICDYYTCKKITQGGRNADRNTFRDLVCVDKIYLKSHWVCNAGYAR